MKRHIQMKVSTVLDMLGTKSGVKQLEKMFEAPASMAYAECERLTANGKIYLETEGCDTDDPFGKMTWVLHDTKHVERRLWVTLAVVVLGTCVLVGLMP